MRDYANVDRPLPGDVCLDLAQGRPVHVLESTDLSAREWSEKNDYDLLENYANSRFGAEPHDEVFECVYCSSAKSKPEKTYAFPESRLLRLETEAADGRGRAYDRIVVRVLRQLYDGTRADSNLTMGDLGEIALSGGIRQDLVFEAYDEENIPGFDRGGD